MSAWRDLLSFSVPGGTGKITGLWFARGIINEADTMYLHLGNIVKPFHASGFSLYPLKTWGVLMFSGDIEETSDMKSVSSLISF